MLSAIERQWSWLLYGSNNLNERFLQVFLVFAVSLLASYWLLWKKMLRKGGGLKMAGPRGLPLVGYLPFLGKNLHQKFMNLAGVYGPIYKLHLGQKVYVVLSSSSLIKEELHEQDLIFANRAPTIAALTFTCGGNDIAMASYGAGWRMLRKVFVHDMLSNANMEAFDSLRREELKKTIRDVYGKIGTPIHIGELAFTTVVNMVTSMVWGGTLEAENGATRTAELRLAAIKLNVLLGRPNVSDFFPSLARFDIQGIERETKKVTVWIERIFDDVIKQQMEMDRSRGKGAEKSKRKDFLQFLLELKDQQDQQTSLTLANIKAIFMDIVLGGTDTTRATVEWVMAEIMRHPKVLNKVHEELSRVVGNNNHVEESHLPKLTYLYAVVKETMRLHPVAPLLLPHCPSQSCSLGGYIIPKGTRILLNVYALHRDPQIWDNPNDFKPERYLNPAKKLDFLSSNYRYLPFGSGRRMCAGFPLAERMIMYVVASFLHSFEWKLPNGTEPDVTEKFGLVLEKMTPLFAIPTPRFSNTELYA